jgi:hypothetical protein
VTRPPALAALAGRRLTLAAGLRVAQGARVRLPQLAGYLLLERQAAGADPTLPAPPQARDCAPAPTGGARPGPQARDCKRGTAGAPALPLALDVGLLLLDWGDPDRRRFDPVGRWLWLRMRGTAVVRRTPPRAWVHAVRALTHDEAAQLWAEACSHTRQDCRLSPVQGAHR